MSSQTKAGATDIRSEQEFVRVFEEITGRLVKHPNVNIESLLQEYPEHAERLRGLLPVIQAMAEVGHARAEVSPAATAVNDQRLSEGTLGDFRLGREIGRGGMGVVYEAVQISLRRKVALKVLPFAAMLDPRQLNRFQNEARAAASLHHTNIVPVFSVGCERSVHFYVMQFIEGESLARIITELRRQEGHADNHGESKTENQVPDVNGQPDDRDAGSSRLIDSLSRSLTSRQFVGGARVAAESPTTDWADGAKPNGRLYSPQDGQSNGAAAALPPAGTPARPHENADTVRDVHAILSTVRSTSDRTYFRNVAELGIQAAEALDYAHEQGIIHRDIKPANLLLDETGRLWVTDFGLARLGTDAGMTMTGDLVGTLRYMSPEQALAKRVVVDHRTDIYSLGATLYELLTLRPTFDGDDREHLLRQIAFEEPAALRKLNRQIPVELETIILKALQKNPADRYSTARELAVDLQNHLQNKPITAKPPTRRERLAKWSRRHPAGVRATSLALLAIIVVIAVSIGLIALDRTVHETVLDQRINQALEESKTCYRSDKLAEAMSALQRAEGLLASGGGHEETRQDVAEWRTDLETVARLEQIRMNSGLMAGVLRRSQVWDRNTVDQAYGTEFKRYGLGVDSVRLAKYTQIEQVTYRIRNSPINRTLCEALDDWLLATEVGDSFGRKSSPGRNELLQIARHAGGYDPTIGIAASNWLSNLRGAILTGSYEMLARVASDPDMAEKPVSSVLTLVRAMKADPKWGTAAQVSILRQVQRRHRDDFWVNFELANCLRRSSNLPAAERAESVGFSRTAVALRPDSQAALIQLAECLEESGNRQEAKQVYDAAAATIRRALSQTPNDTTLYFQLLQLGQVLKSADRLADAEIALRQAIGVRPNSSDAYLSLATTLEMDGKDAEAEMVLREAIRISPNISDLSFALGHLLTKQRKLIDAKAELPTLFLALDAESKGSGVSSDHCDVVIELLDALAADGKTPPDELAFDFVRAIESTDDHRGCDSPRKRVCRALASWVEVFNRVAQLRPKETALWVGRGQYLELREQWHEAASSYARGLHGRWLEDESTVDYAGLLLLDGKGDEYRAFCQELKSRLVHQKDDVLAGYIVSRALALGRNDALDAARVLELAQKAARTYPYAWVVHNVGLAQFRADQYEVAIKTLEHATAMGSASAEALNWIVQAMAYDRLGHMDDAHRCADKAKELIALAEPNVACPDWIEFNVLSREAEKLLQSGTSEETSAVHHDRVPIPIGRNNVEQLHGITTIEGDARGFEWVPLSNELAVLHWEHDIEVFDVRLKSARKLAVGKRPVGFAFSHDGEWLARSEIKNSDGAITVENLKNGSSSTMVTANDAPSVDFSPDGKWLVTGGYGTTASLWQLPDGKKLREFSVVVPPPANWRGDGAGALSPHFSPDGKILAIGNRNCDTRLFDPAKGQLLHILPKMMTQEIKFNPAGTVIATTYVDGTIGLWDVATGKSLHRVKTGAEELYTVDWSPDGKLLVTAGHDAKIILWDATELKPLKELEAPRADWVGCVRFSPDGSRLISAVSASYGLKYGHFDQRIIVWGLSGDLTPPVTSLSGNKDWWKQSGR